MVIGTPIIREKESWAIIVEGKQSEAVRFLRLQLFLELLGWKIYSFLPELFFKKLKQLRSLAEMCEINNEASVECNA